MGSKSSFPITSPTHTTKPSISSIPERVREITMGLDSIGELEIHMILSKLGPSDTAAVGVVSKKFSVWASDDLLWSNICAQELHLTSPLDHLGNPCPSFKAAYKAWREAFGMYPWPLVRRVKSCWDRIKNWFTANFPEVMATLREGASEDQINKFENYLKVKLPLPTRLLYRFCDGQEFESEDSDGSMPKSLLGLIGGYSFYDFHINVYLLPLKLAMRETEYIIPHLGFSRQYKYVVVAASSTYNEKIFFLNCSNGQLYVGTRNLLTDGEMMPCVPIGSSSSSCDSRGAGQQDAMLLWLEEHIRRLEGGVVTLREQGKIRGISLFPEQPPACSTAVTNGVQVRASAVFVPEASDLQSETNKYFFTYSVRMSLAPEGCATRGLRFSSCQLYWRHWRIKANENVVSSVNGEAVIGKYPLLLPGQKEFVYESCSPLPSSRGSIEGSFSFLPGSLADPKGSRFEVEVARFPLQLPDFIY